MMNASGSDWIRLDVRHPELRTRPVLLSHCYADPELPLLREAGVYAVRNATKHSEKTRDAVRSILAERRVRDAAAGPLPTVDETPDCISNRGMKGLEWI
eukprot:g17213.t1